MKLTIKEIMDKCESDDKVNFKGTIEKVFQFNDKPSKYKIGYQNIIVKDQTEKIKVIYDIKKMEDLLESNIEGKEVEVTGTVSMYQGQVNIFGKLKFEDGIKESKSPKGIQSGVGVAPMTELKVTKAEGITIEEIRIKCIKLSLELYKNETEKTTKEIIASAKIFEEYVSLEVTSQKKQTTKKKEEKPKEKKESGNGDQLSVEHIKKINTLMALVENRGETGKAIISKIILKKGYKTVKDFTETDIKEASKSLETIGTDEIPF